MNTRRFSGLAGSPLATIKRGRPQKFANATERQRAHRAKKKKHEAIDKIDSINRGLSMTGGHRLVSGGFDANELGKFAANNGALSSGMTWWAAVKEGVSRQLKGDQINGRKGYRQGQEGKGFGPAIIYSTEKCTETDRTFMDRYCRSFPATWGLSVSQKDAIIKGVLREYISSPDTSTDPNWDADLRGYPVLPATHQCFLCHSMFNFPSDVRTHLLTAEKDGGHLRTINRDIRTERKRLSGNFVTRGKQKNVSND